MGGRRPLRMLAVLALALFGLVWGADGASAHSYLVESDPPNGAILSRPPDRIVLLFSSAVSSGLTTAQLVEARTGLRRQAGAIQAPAPNILVVSLPDLPEGSYRLSFSTRDRLDLHETAGSVVFGIGAAPAAATDPPRPAPPQIWETGLAFFRLCGLSAVLGGLLLGLLVIPRLAAPTIQAKRAQAQAQGAVLALALAGALAQLAAGGGLAIAQAAAVRGPLPGALLSVLRTDYGVRELILAVIPVALAIDLDRCRRAATAGRLAGLTQRLWQAGPGDILGPPGRTLGLALAQTAAQAVSGHAAGTGGLSLGDVLVRAVHIGSMGAWAGGLAALVLALMVLRRNGLSPLEATPGLLAGFGPVAGAACGLLVVSGLLLAGWRVATVTALLSTEYGGVLLAKVSLALVVALLALRHVRLTWRRPAGGPAERVPRWLLGTLALEAAGGAALILAGALLGASAPARGPRFDPPPGSRPTLAARQAGELVASLSVTPNRAGTNLLSVQVLDTRRPALVPVSGVTLLVRRPDQPAESLPATGTGSRFDAGTAVLASGDVTFGIIVHRPGLADQTIEVPWRVETAPVKRAPTVLSAAPIAPVTNRLAGLAAAAGLLVAGGAVGLRARGRWTKGPVSAESGRRRDRPDPCERRRAPAASGRRSTASRRCG